MSSAAVGVGVLIGVVVWGGFVVVARRRLRNWTARLEQSDLDRPEKVHRLQRMMMIISGAVMGFYVIVGALLGLLAGHDHRQSRTSGNTHHDVAAAIVGTVVALVAVLVPPVVLMQVVRKSLVRVREISTKVPNRRRRVLAALCIGVPYGLIIAGGRAVIPQHGAGHSVGIFLVYVVGLFVLASLLLPLIFVRLVTTPMPESTARPLDELAQRIGVRVHGYRTLKTRNQKAANAMQVGTLPGLRYVIVTDYLADHLDRHQLAAVVAHELGHARRHHVLRKFALTFGAWAAAEALLFVIIHTTGSSGSASVLAGPLFLLVPIGIVVTQGLFGVRFERDADDIAARYVGRRELAESLRCLGELNHTKRDTGRAWSILTQHPGLQERLDRLESGAADDAGKRAPAAAGG